MGDIISSMIQGWARQDEVVTRNKSLAEKLQTAKIRGVNKCVNCGWCCTIRACIPTPDEVVIIAKFLGETPHDAILKHFAIDNFSSGDDFFIKPLGENIRDLAGKYIPCDRTFDEGACVFLTDDKKCEIYEVRPRSAREMECWSDKEVFNATKKWSGNVLEMRFAITCEENDEDEYTDW